MTNVKNYAHAVASKEQLGRKLFSEWMHLFHPEAKITNTTGRYTANDCYYIENDTTHITEIKTRDFLAFQQKDYILEETKLKSLLKKCKNGERAIYVNIFRNGHIKLWDLTAIDFANVRKATIKLPTSTVSKGKERERFKVVYFLTPELAFQQSCCRSGLS